MPDKILIYGKRILNGVGDFFFFDGDVFVDVFGADYGVEEEVGHHCHYNPVARHVAYVAGNPFHDEREDTAAHYHHHEDAGCFCGVFAKAFNGEVEDAAPHH